MVLSSYEPGTLCWAKLKGYPWWPSRIEREVDLTAEVLDSKPRNGRVYPVLFFGSLDYAWITPENLEPYEENLVKHGSKAKNRKDPSFSDALKQAVNPKIAENIMKRNATAAAVSDDAEDEVEEPAHSDSDVEMQSVDSDAHTPVKPKAGRRALGNNGKTRKTTTGNKRTSIGSNSSGDEVDANAIPKRSRTIAAKDDSASNNGSPGDNGRRESDDSRSLAKDSPRSGSPSGHPSPEYKSGTSKDDDKNDRSNKGGSQHLKNRSKAYQFCMQLRHRLQKTVIKGTMPEDLTPVHEVFKKLEEFDMTLELIQETKMGKVMRVIAGSDRLGDAPEEAFDIKGRARRLAEKWRRTIIKRRDGSTEPNAPESPSGGKALDPDHQDLEHDPSSANASAKTESEPVAGAGDKQLAIPAAETAPIGATGDKGTNGMMDAAGDAASAAGNPEQQQPLAAGSE